MTKDQILSLCEAANVDCFVDSDTVVTNVDALNKLIHIAQAAAYEDAVKIIIETANTYENIAGQAVYAIRNRAKETK